MVPFKPIGYFHHTATLIDNKLYILGGRLENETSAKDFFYLDVSVPFNTQELSWQDLSNINMVPPHDSATSVKGGANNNTLFLYGGHTTDQNMALVYTFDSQSIIWDIPKITGINMTKKRGLKGIIDYNGKFYLWSGEYDVNGTYVINDMLILDTLNLNCKKGSLVNAPIPRSEYSATLLPDNKIIYIGGANESCFFGTTLNIEIGVALTLSEIYIYDTANDSWNTKITSGKIPSNRAGFSAILGLDGQRVIIYGGYFSNPGYLDTTLYVLDLTNFNWYVPKISGKIPKPRVFHEANLIGKYMVISFGYGYDRTVESDILLLDISNNEEYVWTTSFDPSVPKNIIPSPSPTSSPIPSRSLPPSSQLSDNSSNNSNINIVGAIVGSLLSGIIFLIIGCFFLYKWNKNKQNKKIIYGNDNNYNNYRQEEKEIPTERDYEQAINNEQNIIQINDNEPTNDYHGQEIILTPDESMIIPANDHEQTYKNESTTNHEPIIPESFNNNYNGERFSLQAFKDEMLQAVKQENQNLRNEILQVVKENYNK
ncbi:Kel2p [Rhizophagus irregularis DAOM 197198w]|nr:Kel2p [Rhizophagus irregularis DAOM 197198w]